MVTIMASVLAIVGVCAGCVTAYWCADWYHERQHRRRMAELDREAARRSALVSNVRELRNGLRSS